MDAPKTRAWNAAYAPPPQPPPASPPFSRKAVPTDSHPPVALATAASLSIPPSSYTVTAHRNEAAPHPCFEPCLSVSFHNLSSSQLESLRSAYSGWAHPSTHSRVALSPPPATVNLLDLLPPVFSAVDMHTFSPSSEFQVKQLPTLSLPPPSLALSDEPVQLHFTCFGYLLNLLSLSFPSGVQQPHPITILSPDTNTTLEALTCGTLSTLVIPDFDPSSSPASPEHTTAILPGDYLLTTHETSSGTHLSHASFFIDANLLAEKAGSGEGTPFRLTDLSTFARAWNATPGVFKHQVRRLRRGSGGADAGARAGAGLDAGLDARAATSAHAPLTLAAFPHLAQALAARDARDVSVTRVLSNGRGEHVERGIYTAIVDMPPVALDARGRGRLPQGWVR